MFVHSPVSFCDLLKPLHSSAALHDGLWSREHSFQGQCVSVIGGQQAAWTQCGQMAAAHREQYVPIITHCIQSSSV